jgi:hypothetical protein
MRNDPNIKPKGPSEVEQDFEQCVRSLVRVRVRACVCVWVCIRPVASQQDQKEPVSSSTQPPSNDLPA